MNFDASFWLAYREANIRFADVVASFVRTGDVVWVQDYHLMLLPMLLRSMITGESNQGEMTRLEMGRVKEGVDEAVVNDINIKMPPPNRSNGGNADEGVEMLEDVEEESHLIKSPTLRHISSSTSMTPYQKSEIQARRRGKGGVRIGFFLHTPFPSSEIYR